MQHARYALSICDLSYSLAVCMYKFNIFASILLNIACASPPAGTHYEAFNRKCCFEPGSSLAICKVPIIANDSICDNPDTIIRHFTCRLKPNDDQMACANVSKITIKDDKRESDYMVANSV